MKHTHKKEERRGAVICGAYGRGNAGDDAILRAIMQEMRQLDETMPMRVISRNPTETSRRFGVSACHTFHFKEIWQAVGKAELFVSGGGSLIQNATSSRSLYYYLMTLLMAKLRGCKVMMYGSGIGPVYGKFHRWAAGKIIDRCVDVATLRDEDSRRELGYMGVRKPKCCVRQTRHQHSPIGSGAGKQAARIFGHSGGRRISRSRFAAVEGL